MEPVEKGEHALRRECREVDCLIAVNVCRDDGNDAVDPE